MKTCEVCKRDDLDDAAQRCPHCTSWQAPWRRGLEFTAKVVIWLLVLVFLLGLVTCSVISIVE